MALTTDKNTRKRKGKQCSVPVAANAVCFAGGMAVANATGFAAPGSTALNLTYLGRFSEAVDNTGGADGAKDVLIDRNQQFYFNNDGGDPVTQASVGKPCYIIDDETVSATDGVGTQSACGIVIEIDANGVWVE